VDGHPRRGAPAAGGAHEAPTALSARHDLGDRSRPCR
jgi:hypothetical protein